jgi:1-deoxy-D-xylulose-5-phosphate synthase
VAIAEQHAVTLAAGMACEGAKPVVAIYSTFLQRGYDQLVHDVAVQNLDVLFAIDRAGLVGEDGPTHAGSFDLSYLRCIPGMLVMTPSDENELSKVALLVFGVQLAEALKVAETLDATVVDMRFVKPLDEALVREIAGSHELLVTVEENAIMGGAGGAVSEFLARENILKSMLHLGLPDIYVEHAKPAQMLAECGLDEAGIEASIRERLQLLNR